MNQKYTRTAKSLHWLMALLLIGQLALGFYMSDLPLSPDKLKIYSWHKWAGVTLFMLAFFRIMWRLTHRTPDWPKSMSKLMQLAAHAGHFVLYALMFAIPLSGWLMSSARGIQTIYFKVLPIPDLLSKDKELAVFFGDMHSILSVLLVVVILGHVAAALKHHYFDKDDVLTRMLPESHKENLT